MQRFSFFCILFCVGFCLWSPASPKTLVAWVPVVGEVSAIRMERSQAHIFRESPGCFGKYPGFCLKSFLCWDPDTLERPYGSVPLLCIQTHTHTHTCTHVHAITHSQCTRYHTQCTHLDSPTYTLSRPYTLLYTYALSHM